MIMEDGSDPEFFVIVIFAYGVVERNRAGKHSAAFIIRAFGEKTT